MEEALEADLTSNEEQHFGEGVAAFDTATGQPYQAILEKTATREIPHDRIVAGPFNPRRYFNVTELIELADSMLEDTQLQNILLRPHPTRPGYYEIVFGERRWRAAGLPDPKYNALKNMICRVGEFSDFQASRLAMIENNRRKNVAAIARARGLRNVYEQAAKAGTPMTWTQVGREDGLKNERSTLRYVQMLDLPGEIQQRMEELDLSEKHGRALLLLNDKPTLRGRLLAEIAREELSGNAAITRAETLSGKKPESSTRNSSFGSSAGQAQSGHSSTQVPTYGQATNGDALSDTSSRSITVAPGETTTQPLSIEEQLRADAVGARGLLERFAATASKTIISPSWRHTLDLELRGIERAVERVKKELLGE